MDLISDGLRTLCAWLCEGIYMLVASLYDLFINISRVEILTSEQIHPIYQRITMILTIVMVFYVTFETVKFVIQPEQFSDKEKGAQKIVLRMVLVVLLIAFVPQIFSGAYWVQNKIFDTQVFSKVILGKQDVDSDQFGKNLSYNIFSMFYSLDTESFAESELESKKCGNIACKQVVLMNYNQLRTEGRLTFLTEGLNETGKTTDSNTGEKVEKYYINFNGLFAVGVGAFIAYMLLLYCVDAGVRVVQLLFLQIIAPIPIMAYLSPKKDGMFEKWTKQCLTTYLDLFLRVGIIYFILLICQILGNAFTNGTLVNNVSGNGTWLIYIALIMGLLLFAHKAPKMLEELFPKMGSAAASGNFGLSASKRVAPEAARIAGAALGGTALIGGAIGRGVSRAVRNHANGAKPRWTPKGKEQYDERQKHIQRRKDARRDMKTAEGMQDRVSDEEVTRSKNKVQRAAEAAKNAKGTPEEAQKQKELEKAAAEHRQLMRYRSGLYDKNGNKTMQGEKILDKRHNYAEKRKNLIDAQKELETAKATNDETKISAAQSKVNQAESEFKKAENDYKNTLNSSNASSNVGQNWGGIISAKQTADEKQRQVEQATKDLENAKKEGDSTKIDDAQKRLDALSKENTKAQENMEYQINRYKDVNEAVRTKNFEKLQTKIEEANWQVAKDNNEKYGSVAGAAIVGAVSGAVTGVKEGFKAKKLEEIVPKAKEGWKQTTKSTQELNKYYDNGGAVGIQGFVDRTISQLEKDIGIDTAYARTMMSTKALETKIKDLDAKMVLTKDVSATVDSAEDRLKNKVYDLKTKAIGTIKTGLGTIQADGSETIGDLVRRYDTRADLATNEADSATKMADQLAKEAQDAQILAQQADTDPKKTTEEKNQLKENARIKYEAAVRAKEDANIKSQKATDAKYEAKEIKKYAARNAYTQILNDTDPESRGSYYDQAAVQMIKDAQRSIRLASQEPELREKVKDKLVSSLYRADASEEEKANSRVEIQRLYDAFVTGQITNFDDIDTIKTAVKNAESEYARDKKDFQERKRKTETSELAQSQKAAQDYNGNSGK